MNKKFRLVASNIVLATALASCHSLGLGSSGSHNYDRYDSTDVYKKGLENIAADILETKSENNVKTQIDQVLASSSPVVKVAEQTINPISNIQTSVVNAVSTSSGRISQIGSLYNRIPENAGPGECFAKVRIPAEYRTETSQVLVRDAELIENITPAQYQSVTEKVLVKEAQDKIAVVPAKYRTEQAQVLVKPERTVSQIVPAIYGTASERVLVTPARVEWKPGRGLQERVDNATGEIMCRVEIPAVYNTITKRVVKTPARTVTKTIPAVYKTVTKQVLDTPATTQIVGTIPAVYNTVAVTKEISPAKISTKTLPAQYKTVSKKIMVSPESVKWKSVVCETNKNYRR